MTQPIDDTPSLRVRALLGRTRGNLNRLLLYATEWPNDSHVMDAKQTIKDIDVLFADWDRSVSKNNKDDDSR